MIWTDYSIRDAVRHLFFPRGAAAAGNSGGLLVRRSGQASGQRRPRGRRGPLMFAGDLIVVFGFMTALYKIDNI